MKEGKKPKFTLGVAEAKLGNAIQEQMGFPCACNEQTGELLRGVRAHAGHLTKARFMAPVLSDADDGFPNCKGHVLMCTGHRSNSRGQVLAQFDPVAAGLLWQPAPANRCCCASVETVMVPEKACRQMC